MRGWVQPMAMAMAVAMAALGPAALGAEDVVRLSLKDAETRAVDNHPKIRAAQYSTLAAGETVREIKSSYFPTVFGSFTGAQAQNGDTVIAAGGLNNSTVLDRFAYGFSASQLLTDFGKTSRFASSAELRVDAGQQDVAAERANVLLDVDRAYFDALRTQAVEHVAEETVAERQTIVDQVSSLTAAGLKSELDLSFAKVSLAEAQLLLVQSKNDVQSAYASLSAAMGAPQTATYELLDEAAPAPPAADSTALIAEALRDRPDVARERLAQLSTAKLADAEHAQWFPTLSLIGVAGLTPFHRNGLADRYSAVGVNVTVPLSNGSLYSAQQAEANFRARAAQQTLQDLENRVARDVQTAWLNAQTAFQRRDLTDQFLLQANDALDLAQRRYDLGLSSIIELNQAQLNQTEARIQQTTAEYEYQTRDAILRFQIGALK